MTETLIAQEVFASLRPDQVDALSEAAERVRCAPGDVIYTKGAPAHHFFVVLEGEVTLRLPGRGGVGIVIDQLGKGAMFGSCVCFNRDSYALTAQSTSDSLLLKVKSAALKELMDRDLVMGYALQTRISEIYFARYIETMKKLQAIVMNIPIETS
ncbi:MAG: cyclic nucleotide-binding domain-containing protein [Gemmatimonadota bacterium]|nr:MAG: cyclic nucleotide-binding domain-containing protein [Gemmatimonadota bacterium]